MQRSNVLVSSYAFLLALVASPALAHFPWLVVNQEGQAVYFFGEDLSDRTYHLPESISKANIHCLTPDGKQKQLSLYPVETDTLVGLQSKESLPKPSTVFSHVIYGNYHGAQLNYYTIHQVGQLPPALPESNEELPMQLDARLAQTQDGIEAQVHWQGQALGSTQVQLFNAKGDEVASTETDGNGRARFAAKHFGHGLHAIRLGQTVPVSDSKDFDSAAHYLTLTFEASKQGPKSTVSQTQGQPGDKLPDLPFEITSFGAARLADTIYVYGGHTGDAHSYSVEEQSNKLLALDLSSPEQGWIPLSKDDRLQGLALVAHGSNLIRIGGFTAKNERGDEHDLESQESVRIFDTESKSWRDLPALPSGRSSHDAAILGDTIYVVGGWNMTGEDETQWHTSALSLDLSADEPVWRELPKPPFERRALATVAHAGKLYAIGGMDKDAGPTKRVDIFDPEQQSWSRGPDLIGDSPMAGFGAAGWSQSGQLIVTTYEGNILALSEDGESWNQVGKSEDARFFHRLIPYQDSRLISLGGANMEVGKYVNLEIIPVR